MKKKTVMWLRCEVNGAEDTPESQYTPQQDLDMRRTTPERAAAQSEAEALQT
ncbi:MAG: hypothetical protein V4724_23210 [Pseudomonadota bacterium]